MSGLPQLYIPLSSDKTRRVENLLPNPMKLYIPLSSDKTHTQVKGAFYNRVLYIPLSSDKTSKLYLEKNFVYNKQYQSLS